MKLNILSLQSQVLLEGASVQQTWQAAAPNLSVKGCNGPREPSGEARARSSTSHLNESVWWSWLWVGAVACGPQNLISLVKGDVFMQETCQLDCTGLLPPRTPQEGSSGGSKSGCGPTYSCACAPHPQNITEMLFIIFDIAAYGTWMSGSPAVIQRGTG